MSYKLEDIYKYNTNKKIIKYHMPGNYGGKSLNKKLVKSLHLFEATEVLGMDDYHKPQGIIKEAESRTADLFGSKECIYLVNGSSSGIMATMSYLFKEGDRVLVGRDSHKSVINGAVIAGLNPIYCTNDYNSFLGIYMPLSYERIREAASLEPQLKGIVITTPNYYGIGSKEITRVAQLCVKNNLKLIVDEAHGSHLYFTEFKKYLANICGADVVVNSTHKNLTGLTQTGVLNVNCDSIDIEGIRDHLSLITTTSPSYPLLASIVYCTLDYEKKGIKNLRDTIKKANYMKELLNKYKIRYIKGVDLKGDYFLDPSKITILTQNNHHANRVYEQLTGMNIMPEMVVGDKIIFFINKMISFSQITKTVKVLREVYTGVDGDISSNYSEFKLPLTQALAPREAFYSTKERIHYTCGEGRISAASITPYPPGIPVIFPGQIISKELIEYLSNNSSSFHGLNNGMIEVVK